MPRPLPTLFALALSLGFLPSSVAAQAGVDPFAGTFRGDGLTLVLEATGGGEYRGAAEEDGMRFNVQARVSGSTLEGEYSFFGIRAPFRGVLEGDRMVVETADDRYELLREGAQPVAHGVGGQGVGGAASVAAAAGAAGSTPPASDEVDDPAWGLRFRIPAGWQMGEQEEGSWILVSSVVPGAMVVADLEAETLAELQALVSGDIVAEGVNLKPGGVAESIGDAGMGVEVTGTLGGTEVHGYAAGVVSPHGPGVTVLAITEPGKYEPGHRDAARALAESVRFRAPPAVGGDDWWSGQLSGQVLKRFSRTSTQGGGSTSETTVTLCRDGRGAYHWTYQMSLSVEGVFANNSDQDQGEGRWEVVDRGGQPLLVMRFNDGRVFEWTLSMANERINLDGNEYLRDNPVC